DAGRRLAGLFRFLAGKIVESAPGVAVDHRERLVFFGQMGQRRDQRQMLDHIGEISRVIGVSVVHPFTVMAGLDPAIQYFTFWMAGSEAGPDELGCDGLDTIRFRHSQNTLTFACSLSTSTDRSRNSSIRLSSVSGVRLLMSKAM